MEAKTILTGDYHTHTNYSHGKGTVMQNALAAKRAGIAEIAITDHGFSHPAFGLRRRKISALRAEIEEAKRETGVSVLLGMESNLRGVKGATDMRESDYENMDIYLCGIHRFIFFSTVKDWCGLFFGNYFTSTFKKRPSKGLIKTTTDAYVNAIKRNPIDCITHLNYLCFADAVEVAKAARDYGTYLEINTKKVHLSNDELLKVADTGVRFIVDSDAHQPERVGDTALFDKILTEIDFPLSQIDNIDGRKPNFRFSTYKKEHM